MRPTLKDKKNALIFFVGTLAPFHHGHLDLLDSAKRYLEQSEWNVIGGYASTFVNRKEGRIGPLYTMLGQVSQRSAILQLGAMHSDWLMVDHPVAHVLRANLIKRGVHPIQQVAKRLRDAGVLGGKDEVTTFWVNGSDGYLDPEFFAQFAEHADDDPHNPLRMLVVENRPGGNSWSAKEVARVVPSLAKYILRHRQHMKSPTSATAVRNAMNDGNRTLFKEAVGLPLVESYLLGILHEHVSAE